MYYATYDSNFKLHSACDTTESKLCGVGSNAESKLCGACDTPESKLCGVTSTAESQNSTSKKQFSDKSTKESKLFGACELESFYSFFQPKIISYRLEINIYPKNGLMRITI